MFKEDHFVFSIVQIMFSLKLKDISPQSIRAYLNTYRTLTVRFC